MKIKIAGVHILFQAIESIHFERETRLLVIRTVSGKEHSQEVENEELAERMALKIIDRIALCGSI